MKILDIKVLRGPNYWSNFRNKLIVVTLDIQQYENLPTNKLEGFNEALIKLFPSLQEHKCSLGVEGGFIQRLEEGTWLGHVIEHIALELQYMAGMNCSFGRARSSNKKNVYYIIFSYEIESAGIYAAKTAAHIVQTLAESKPYSAEELQEDIDCLKEIVVREGFGPSTKSIITEVEKRDIPYVRLTPDSSLILLGQGINQKLINATATSETSVIGVDLVCNKDITKKMLAASYIPVPNGLVVSKESDLNEVLYEIGFPVVIKPLHGNHGRGVTTNIQTEQQAHHAFHLAREHSKKIVIEKFITGFDHRLLVINYKLVAAAKRIPACVVGDGQSTIQELIEKINHDPKRGRGHENMLTRITVDETTKDLLAQAKLNFESILPLNKEFYLKHAANISTGGTAIDVTDEVHEQNFLLAERIARILHLNLCGIDLICDSIAKPIDENNGTIIEVNASPGLRMHLSPTQGLPRNVAKPIVDMIFPHNTSGRIPVTAVTGTNGKTTIVRMIAHMAKEAGYTVGYTNTDGVYINTTSIFKGDCSGPISAQSILRDPTVDFAVFECARGGIISAGLGFDKCNVSIVTNITEDHLGLKDIETLSDLARVKSVVPKSTFENGYAILNADDDLVYDMINDVDCNVALFSLHPDNKRIIRHCERGGMAAYLDNNTIYIQQGNSKEMIPDVNKIPLTLFGTATCMIQNLLPIVLAGVIHKFELFQIIKWIKKFSPSPENLPGRMNIFDFKEFTVLVDYAHNVGAYREFEKYMDKIKFTKRVGIIGVPGDRRDQDIRNMGFYAAKVFDEIIIRHDRQGRGRTREEITRLLSEGIREGNPLCKIKIISEEIEAVNEALQGAKKNSLIAIFPEKIFTIIEHLNYMKGMFRKKAKAS